MGVKKATTPETVAAVDLGSNNFHMIVAKVTDHQLKIVDRLRDMVRLASGLDQARNLTPEIQQRAYESLRRFGQRLGPMTPNSVRVVGTNTLRSARNSPEFLYNAQEALGYPIEIISGLEEARLIYLGVAHTLADTGTRRLVVDIGGGSTEVIVGERFEPLEMESLYMGCVSYSHRFFPGGAITRKRLKCAELAARVELEPFEERYRKLGWGNAVGASGTIQAVEKVMNAAGWSEKGITRDALERLVDVLARSEHIDKLNLKGLSERRRPVFPGGVVILRAIFEALDIDVMEVSDGALREGLLYDLLGRIHHEDVRQRSVDDLAKRYHVDLEQADRVMQTAKVFYDDVAPAWNLDDEEKKLQLMWAAKLHEIGLDIAHSHYHKHGAYVAEHTDLFGFSRQEQRLLASLIRAHRRKFPVSVFKTLPQEWVQPIQRIAMLLRLAALLHRSRSKDALPEIKLVPGGKSLHIAFPENWLEQHPLTRADLDQEAESLAAADFELSFNSV